MKRLICLLCTGVIALSLFAGCGGDTGKGINSEKDKPKPVQNDG